jgi:hypothetical protein
MTLGTENGPVYVRLSSIRRLDISTGKSRVISGLRGALAGAVIGGAGGYVILKDVDDFLTSSSFRSVTSSLSSGGRAGLVSGMLAGGAAGLLIGSMLPVDRWQRVELNASAGSREGAGLTMLLRIAL